MHKKSQPAPVLKFNSVSRQLEEQQEATTHCGSEFETDILTLTKEALVLICDSMGRSEILG